MSFDGYLKLDGIPGECSEDKHKDWIEILSYGIGLVQPTSGTHTSAGGLSASNADWHDLSITHLLDKASPKLIEACVKGTSIATATFELFRAGGASKFKYLEIAMTKLLVSSVVAAGEPSGGAGFPTESFTLHYSTIKYTYFQQTTAGGSAGQVSMAWDLGAHKTM